MLKRNEGTMTLDANLSFVDEVLGRQSREALRNRVLPAVGAMAVCLSSITLAADAVTPESAAGRITENVLLVTIDGLRWQEVFAGADETLMNKEFGGVRELASLNKRFWRDDVENRRAALMPFFWSVIATQGKLYGDPEYGSLARVANPHRFSYPGYNELLTGIPDPKIDSNDKVPNPHVTVLEWLHRKPTFRGRVQAFSSWDVFPYIINTERSGIPVNAGWQPLDSHHRNAELSQLDRVAEEVPRYWENVRYDYFTFQGALAAIKQDRPRVLYVAFGETDDWAHAGRYDLYLDAAWRTDRYIEQLWHTMQRLPQYAGKTSLVLTTDHGRGDGRIEWKSHGDEIPGCEAVWIAVLGPDIPAGPAKDVAVTQSQVAATVAALLGFDFPADVSAAAPPLPGVTQDVPVTHSSD